MRASVWCSLVVLTMQAGMVLSQDKPAAPEWQPLNPEGTILIQRETKTLRLKSQVCLREGLLEMLACLKGTKEHEAILAVPGSAQMVHAGLLALGLEPGKPVTYQPEYRPASGPLLDITLEWTDASGKVQRAPATSWIRHATRRYFTAPMKQLPGTLKLTREDELRFDERHKELLWYGPMTETQRDLWLKKSDDAEWQKAIKGFYDRTRFRPLDARFVFAGSHFYKNPKTGEELYEGEAGDLICVANFPSAVIDLSISSSNQNDDLNYEAWTDRIPEIGTTVLIDLSPAKAAEKAAVPGK